MAQSTDRNLHATVFVSKWDVTILLKVTTLLQKLYAQPFKLDWKIRELVFVFIFVASVSYIILL